MAIIQETIPFNFDDLYQKTKEKFIAKGYDTSEGSNTSQLITGMAYLISMLNTNTAVNINETILPLARKIDNARQDARVLGYEVSNKQSYKYRLTIELGAGDHTIPKYEKFTADGKTFYYVGQRLDILNAQAGTTIEIDVKEGTLYKFSDYPESLVFNTTAINDASGNTIPQYYIDIPYVDVEDDGIEVFLTYYDVNGNLFTKEKWYKTREFLIDQDTSLVKNYVRIDDINTKTPRLYFSLANIGSTLRVGTIIEANVLTTSGINGKIDDISDPNIFSTTLQNLTITSVKLQLQGTNEESIDSVKKNAPLFHNSANRAITEPDFTAICNRHPAVKTSMVWGGDNEYPKSPGHIWFTFLPSTNTRSFTSDAFNILYQLDTPDDLVNWYIENAEIRSTSYNADGVLDNPGVWDILDGYKIPTLEYHHRNPIYLDFTYTLEILKYSSGTPKSTLHENVFNTINTYFFGENDVPGLENFETEYFNSTILKRIDNILGDASGCNAALSTRLMLTSKNITTEVTNPTFKDIYIPLAVPYEEYFDINGDLIPAKLPNIDTTDFATVYNLYTDWAPVVATKSDAIIVAEIRAACSESYTATSDGITVIPLSVLDMTSSFATINPVTAFNLVVKVNSVPLTFTTEYTLSAYNEITLVTPINTNDVVDISMDGLAGRYYLFNDYRKYIIAHLYINSENYIPGPVSTDPLYDEPKSYLTSVDGYYGYTTNQYYVTTEGYVVQYTTDTDINTGSIVTLIDPTEWQYTPLRLQNMASSTMYLNFGYSSPNFKVAKNIIPRLKEVSFI